MCRLEQLRADRASHVQARDNYIEAIVAVDKQIAEAEKAVLQNRICNAFDKVQGENPVPDFTLAAWRHWSIRNLAAALAEHLSTQI